MRQNLAYSLIISAAFTSLSCIMFPPLWRTNDDVGMAMFAHGYGMAFQASNKLFFSNVIWGDVVQFFPHFGHMDAYGLAALLVLMAVCAVFIYFLLERKWSLIFASTLVAFLLFESVVSPQFTITAGLCMVCSLFFINAWKKDESHNFLAMAIVFALISFLIRDQEALFVAAIALPLFVSREMIFKVKTWLFVAVLLAALMAVSAYDQASYSSSEWKEYNELNMARAAFTDFSVGREVRNDPLLLAQHSYSENDIQLIQTWFFEDINIASPVRLNKLVLNAVSKGIDNEEISARLVQSWRTITKPRLLPILLLGLLLLILGFGFRLLLAWLLLMCAVIAIGVLGRPGVTRIYEPVLVLLVMYPLLNIKFNELNKQLLLLSVVIVLIVAGVIIGSKNYQANQEAIALNQEMKVIFNQTDPLFVWGSALPYSLVFPVFRIEQIPSDLTRIYAMGSSALAPGSVAIRERKLGRGFLDRLFSDEGLTIIAGEGQLGLLNTYCKEHHRKYLIVKELDYLSSSSRLKPKLITCVDSD